MRRLCIGDAMLQSYREDMATIGVRKRQSAD
jgi:hypothetical protein